MDQAELIPHLFRTECRKITAVLCKSFGIAHLQTAEDIASDTFLKALETWPYKGVPENPVAWLYTVARNKALNFLGHEKIFREKVAPGLSQNMAGEEPLPVDFSEQNITDSQLQMLFAVCHPCIPPEAQTGLALRILCGFGIDEIAHAFLTTRETINKRLYRAREKLRAGKIPIGLPPETEFVPRLESVLRTIYLLFSEGYYSESDQQVLREELCLEAMRLTYLLIQDEHTNKPPVNALMALMCFHASRFPARKNESGELVLYHEQDESLWNTELIAKGAYYLHRASGSNGLSSYHLEAGIAYWHTRKEDSTEKWSAILGLYNQLLQLQYSPVAALNRTYALARLHGNDMAIREAEELGLLDNPYYHSLLGVLYQVSDPGRAREHFQKALTLARTDLDKKMILKKLADCH